MENIDKYQANLQFYDAALIVNTKINSVFFKISHGLTVDDPAAPSSKMKVRILTGPKMRPS